jgi:hypothetical protein
MKNSMIIFLMLAGTFTGRLLSQNPVTSNEKMKPFASWVGHWQGEGSMRMGPGEPKKTTVDEQIELKLDGAVLLVEGVGKNFEPGGKETVVHHALAVLSYDQAADKYTFKSWLKDGRSTDAWFQILAENKYQWGFDTPRGKTRYNITIDPISNTWNETGEFSNDGTKWMPFFEMNLKKQDQ